MKIKQKIHSLREQIKCKGLKNHDCNDVKITTKMMSEDEFGQGPEIYAHFPQLIITHNNHTFSNNTARKIDELNSLVQNLLRS